MFNAGQMLIVITERVSTYRADVVCGTRLRLLDDIGVSRFDPLLPQTLVVFRLELRIVNLGVLTFLVVLDYAGAVGRFQVDGGYVEQWYSHF